MKVVKELSSPDRKFFNFAVEVDLYIVNSLAVLNELKRWFTA